MYKWLSVLLVVVCFACASPLAGSNSGFLPVAGEYPGLIPDGKRIYYLKESARQQYLGNRAAIFDNYGIENFFHNNYTLNGASNYLTIESFQISGNNGAAGVFYYYVRRKLLTKGKLVDIGAQGVLDVVNDGRNLYFFKGHWFFSIVYSGKSDIPDLIPLARSIAAKIPGDNWKPSGFRYLEVQGIAHKYAYVTPGNAMNFEFLPPSVTTFVSSVGLQSNIFISNFFGDKEAKEAKENFTKFMSSTCEEYKTIMINVDGNSYKVRQGIDEKEGLLMFVPYRKTIISISKITDEAQAKLLMERVIRKIKNTPGK